MGDGKIWKKGRREGIGTVREGERGGEERGGREIQQGIIYPTGMETFTKEPNSQNYCGS